MSSIASSPYLALALHVFPPLGIDSCLVPTFKRAKPCQQIDIETQRHLLLDWPVEPSNGIGEICYLQPGGAMKSQRSGRVLAEDTVDDTDVEVQMRVQRRAKALNEGDGAEACTRRCAWRALAEPALERAQRHCGHPADSCRRKASRRLHFEHDFYGVVGFRVRQFEAALNFGQRQDVADDGVGMHLAGRDKFQRGFVILLAVAGTPEHS